MINHIRSIALVSALTLSIGAITPSAAQLSGGPGVSIKFYDIISADGLNTHLGQVMTIPDMIMNPPKGFDAGQEYWYWNNPSQAYPDGFVIVTSYKPTPISDKVEDYDSFDHLAFDLSDPHPFPKSSILTEVEWTYSVFESDNKGKPQDTTVDAWFAFEDGGLGEQFAWARKDIEGKYLHIEASEGLLFVADKLPAPGSVEVVEAK